MQLISKCHRKQQLLLLVYLFIPFCYVFTITNIVKMMTIICLFILFAFVYLVSWSNNERTRIIAIAIEIILLVFLSIWFSPFVLWLMFYPAAAAGGLDKRKMIAGVLCVLIAGVAVLFYYAYLSRENYMAIVPIVLAGVIGIMGAALGNYSTRMRLLAQEKLLQANSQIERLTKIAERERISQDLHDVMGHQLSMITLKSQLVHRLLERDKNIERAQVEIKDIEAAARNALAQVREYVSGIRQADFLEEWRAAIKLLEAANIQCTSELPADLCFNSKPYQVLAMCLRESVTNIVRHSEATSAILKLKQTNDVIYLFVADNGIGVKGPKAREIQDGTNQGNGVNGIRARLATVFGQLAFWNQGQQIGDGMTEMPFTLPWTTGAAVLMRVPVSVDDAQFTDVVVQREAEGS